MASNETYEKFLCPTCGKMLGTSSSLKSHMRIHARSTYGKQYKCDFCVATFLHFGTLSRHLLIFHQKIQIIPPKERLKTRKESEVSCLVCNKTFSNNYRLERHMSKHGKWPECDFCHSIFRSKSRLSSHLQSRTSSGICPLVLDHEEYNKNFMCAVCGKLYSRRQDFSDHMSLHTGEKLHKCDYCEKRYRHRCHFLRHVKMEHKVKPIKKNTVVKEHIRCDKCNKTFKCKSHLMEHLRIHFDERPLKCKYCDKRFRFLSSLRKHEQSRLLKKTCLPIGVGSYKCDYCGKRFVHRFSLFKHIKALHGGYPVRKTIIESRELICDGTGELKETCVKEIAMGDKPDVDKTISLPGYTKELEENCGNEISVEGNSDACRDTATPSTNVEGYCDSSSFPKGNHDKDCVENSDGGSDQPLPNCDAAIKLDLHKNGNKDISTERFECTVCGKLCLSNGHLLEHTRHHTGERPFKCNFCGMKFGYTSTFYRHVRTLHKTEPDKREVKEILNSLSQKEVSVTDKKGLKCSLCNKIFEQSCSLEEHFKTSHKEEIGAKEILMDKKIVEATECRHKVKVKCAKISLANGSDAQNKLCRRVLKSVSASKDIKDKGSSSTFLIENRDKVCTKNYEERCAKPLPNCDAAFESNKSNGIRDVSKKRFKCTVCSKIFNDNSHLREHARHHTGEQPFKCNFCGMKFGHTSSFYRHVRTVHKTEPDKSGVKDILDSLSLKEVSVTYRKGPDCHAALKNNLHKRFKCALCGKLFSNKGHLREHRRQHTGEKPFKCNFCRMEFTHRSSFYRHVRSVHKTEPDKREVKEILDSLSRKDPLSFKEKLLKCNLCEKSFKQTGSLHRHLRMSHKSRKHVAMKTLIKEKAVQANSCRNSETDIDETISLQGNAEELVENSVNAIYVEGNSDACRDTATPSTNVEGNVDSSTFSKDNNDKDCMENSVGESNEPLPNFDTLKRNSHKRFKCVVCSKFFLSKGHLREHAWLHAGEKPFKCDFCGMEFTHRSSFYRHVRTVHKTEPDKRGVQELVDSLSKTDPLSFEEELLKCNLCGKSFKQTSSLQRHLRISHKSRKHVPMKTLIKEKAVEANSCCKNSDTEINETISLQDNAGEREENSDGESYEPLPNCETAINLDFPKNVNRNISTKRFQCTVCGKLFSNKGHLREHRWHHTGKKLFKCNFCEMMYSHRSSFYRHVRTIHKTEPDKKGIKEIFKSSFQKDPLHFDFEEKLLKYNLCEKGSNQSGSLQRRLIISHKSRDLVAQNMEVETDNACKNSDIDETISLQGIQCNAVELEENCVHEISVEGNSDACRDVNRGVTVTPSTDVEDNDNSSTLPEDNHNKGCVENSAGGSVEPLPNCDAAFKLDLHKNGNRDISTKRFKCALCGKLFSNKGHLREHRRQHTGEKPFKCNFCRMEFTHRSSFYRHVRIVHKTEPDKRKVKEILDSLSRKDPLSFKEKLLKCNLCDKSFKQSGSLQRHLRMSHVAQNMAVKAYITCKNSYIDETISLQCEDVELVENSVNEISVGGNSDACRDTATSTNVQGYCDSSAFSKDNNDKDSVEISVGESDEPLPNCDAALKRNWHKRFKCTLCSKFCLTKGHLREHIWHHTGEKPFKCNFCRMEFTHRSSFYRHVRIVHKTEPDKREVKEILDSLSRKDPLSFEEKLLKCNLCDKSFKQSGSLQRHLRISHVAQNMAVKTYITCKKSYIDETISLQCEDVELVENSVNEISVGGNSDACRDTATSTNVQGYCDSTTFSEENNDKDCVEISVGESDEPLPNCDAELKRNSHKRFKCIVCSKLFLSKGHLREHRRQHTGEKPFKCNFCRMEFTHRSSFYRHVRIVHKTEPDKRNVKEILDSLSRKDPLSFEEKLLKCNRSEKSFKQTGSLQRHLRMCHKSREHVAQNMAVKTYITCKKSYIDETISLQCEDVELEENSVNEISVRGNSDACRDTATSTNVQGYCDSSAFSKDNNDKDSVENFDGESDEPLPNFDAALKRNWHKRFKCTLCSKFCLTKGHLREHIWHHTGEKPFKCNFCGMEFTHRSSFYRHVRTVHKTEPDKKGVQELVDSLTKKDPLSFEEKLLKCNLCEKSFKQTDSLQRHLRMLHKSRIHFAQTMKVETDISCKNSDVDETISLQCEDVELEENCVHEISVEDNSDACRDVNRGVTVTPSTNIESNDDSSTLPEDNHNKDCVENSAGGSFEQLPNYDAAFKLDLHKDGNGDISTKRFQCTECGKLFSNSGHLREHRWRHTGEKPFKCNSCGMKFSHRSTFYRHVRTVHKTEPDKRGVKEILDSLSQEEVSVTDKKGLKYELLPNCDVELKRNSHKRFKCVVCSKFFLSKGHLREHAWLHAGEKPFKCNFCGMKFTHRSSFYRHVRTVHKTEPDKKGVQELVDSLSKIDPLSFEEKLLKCNFCGKGFKQTGSLKRHFLLSHNESPKHQIEDIMSRTEAVIVQALERKQNGDTLELECPECGKIFDRVHHLRDHMPTHTKEKRHKCYFCEERFSHYSSRVQHIKKYHEGCPIPKPQRTCTRICNKNKFLCSLCGKTAKHPSDLLVHMRLHTGETPYSCEFCNKKFRYRASLFVHRRKREKHGTCPRQIRKVNKPKATTNKLYQCRYCDKIQPSLSDLNEHVRIHTGEKPFECVCGRTFKLRGSFKRHVKEKNCPENFSAEKLVNGNACRYDKFKCAFCDIEVSQLSCLKEHMKQHSREKLYSCSCGQTFKYYNNLFKHIMKGKHCLGARRVKKPMGSCHEEIGGIFTKKVFESGRIAQYECPFCKKLLFKLSRLRDHVIRHTGLKPFHCEFCGKRFGYQSSFFKHIKSIHKGIPYSRKYGNFIDIKFDDTVRENPENVSLPTTTTMSEDGYHNMESGKESPMGAGVGIKCTEDADNEWKFDNSPDNNVNSLTMERSTNELERSYKCTLCVRHFSKKFQLQTHMETHKEESDTPFHCQFCHSGFFHKSSMQRHLKFRNLHGICCGPRKATKVKKQGIRKKTKIYKCPLCSKIFTRLSHFQVHMTRHTGVKSYKCDFCEVSLKYKNSYKRHMKTYHPEEYLGKGEPLESRGDDSVGVMMDVCAQDIVEIKKSDEDVYSGNQSPPYLDTDGRTVVVVTSGDIGSIEDVDNKIIYSAANKIETLESYQGKGDGCEDDITTMILDYI